MTDVSIARHDQSSYSTNFHPEIDDADAAGEQADGEPEGLMEAVEGVDAGRIAVVWSEGDDKTAESQDDYVAPTKKERLLTIH